MPSLGTIVPYVADSDLVDQSAKNYFNTHIIIIMAVFNLFILSKIPTSAV